MHELKPQVKYINTSFDWSPSGKQLVYAVNKHNRYGEDYRDIFIHDMTSKTDIRLSQSARLESPAWHPQGHGLLAVQQSKGTQNLVWASLPDSANWNEQIAQAIESNSPEIILDEWEKWTSFEDGQTIFSPVWHPNGQRVYGAYAYLGERQLFSFDTEENAFHALTDASFDLRDPYVDATGSYLYFSAAPNGRFNLYRVALDSKGFPVPDRMQQLTDVLGGAFMPVEYKGRLYYSEYVANGYTLRSRPIRAVSISEDQLGFTWLGYNEGSQQPNAQLNEPVRVLENQPICLPLQPLTTLMIRILLPCQK